MIQSPILKNVFVAKLKVNIRPIGILVVCQIKNHFNIKNYIFILFSNLDLTARLSWINWENLGVNISQRNPMGAFSPFVRTPHSIMSSVGDLAGAGHCAGNYYH